MNEPATERQASSFNLEERLLEFGARVIRVTTTLHRTAAGKHVANQVPRSGTSPLAHHGEAQAAESRRDFIHKMKIALKELRETTRWLKLIQITPLMENPELLNALVQEADELTRIFVASIRTAEQNHE